MPLVLSDLERRCVLAVLPSREQSELDRWFEQILNYFDKRITNGFVEGINRAIRFIILRAFGFRNFDNFRLQVVAQYGPPG